MTLEKPDHAAGAERRGRYIALAACLTLVGLGVSLAMASVADGFYQDDDACHYLFARSSWRDVPTMLHWWARPGHNLPMMFAARLGGMFGCRVLSALMTAATAWLAWCVARRVIGDTPAAAVAPLLVWVQPLVMTLSTTTLTETPAALYLVLGAWLLLRGNTLWAAAAWSLLFVTRLETLALAPLFAGAFAWDAWKNSGRSVAKAMRQPRLWASAALLLWAPAAYVLAAAMVDMPPDGDPLLLFSRSYDTQYGTGPLHHYPAIWPVAAGFGVLTLAVVGAVRLGRRVWFSSAAVFGLLALQAVLFRFGLFATGGYARFMVPAAGLLAVLAAGGLHVLLSNPSRTTVAAAAALTGAWLGLSGMVATAHMGLSAVLVLAAVTPFVIFALVAASQDRHTARTGRVLAVVLVVLAVGQAAAQVRPPRLSESPMHRLIADAVGAVEDSAHAGNPMLTQHVVAHCLADGTLPAFSIADSIDKWRRADDGTLFLWESKYCQKDHERQESELLLDELDGLGGMIFQDTDAGNEVRVYVRGLEITTRTVRRQPTTRPVGQTPP